MSLEENRKKINEIDNKILDLLKKRVKAVKNIGKIKENSDGIVYIPEREKQIFDKLTKKNDTGLEDKDIINIYTEIISACRNLESSLSVAYLGPKASFTHSAAVKKFGSAVKFNSQNSIEEIFDTVERSKADYGVIPIENSTEGTVTYTLDKFFNSDLNIVSEIELKISHAILSKENRMDKIECIYSHPQSFAQCKNWLIKNLPNAALKNVNSNSYAAKLAAKEDNSAAIGPKLAGKEYGLNILETSIQDFRNNTTRFLVIGKNINDKSGDDKTSIMFSPKEKVGALYEILQYFYDEKINLTMIESRPNKKNPWQYVFFIDFEGHFSNTNVKRTLEKIEKISTDFKILGSYPRINQANRKKHTLS
ncbi:MAG: prephenate dehydratase [Fusobacteriota bacterium]